MAALVLNCALLQPCGVRGGAQVADPKCCDYDKRTPLHLAASEGSYKVAEWLLEQKADVNALDRFKRTPLEVRALPLRCMPPHDLHGHQKQLALPLQRAPGRRASPAASFSRVTGPAAMPSGPVSATSEVSIASYLGLAARRR